MKYFSSSNQFFFFFILSNSSFIDFFFFFLSVTKEENVAIFRRNIMYRRVLTRDISGFIARNRWFGDKSAIFLRYIAWSTRVNESQTRYSAGQRATVPPHFACCWEDLNPKPKGLGFTRLPPGLSCPLIHNMQQIYIYLNSLYKKNIRIF